MGKLHELLAVEEDRRGKATKIINESTVWMTYSNKTFTLELHTHRTEGGALVSPVLGAMEGRIRETMKSKIETTLIDNNTGKKLFHDEGLHAGLEVVGDMELLGRRVSK